MLRCPCTRRSDRRDVMGLLTTPGWMKDERIPSPPWVLRTGMTRRTRTMRHRWHPPKPKSISLVSASWQRLVIRDPQLGSRYNGHCCHNQSNRKNGKSRACGERGANRARLVPISCGRDEHTIERAVLCSRAGIHSSKAAADLVGRGG
jgi:hypothetical protein